MVCCDPQVMKVNGQKPDPQSLIESCLHSHRYPATASEIEQSGPGPESGTFLPSVPATISPPGRRQGFAPGKTPRCSETGEARR